MIKCRFQWLKDRFGNPPQAGAREVECQAHTTGLIMEMIGSLICPDNSKDCVPSFYAQFISWEQPKVYSWASALLTCLYRGLCESCHISRTSIYGPLYFLQVYFT